CLTKKSGRVKERELVHQSLIESGGVDLRAAFEQHAGDLYLRQANQCLLQRNTRSPVRNLLQANAGTLERLLRCDLGLAKKDEHVLVSSLDQLGVQRSAQIGVQHNALQRPPPGQ